MQAYLGNQNVTLTIPLTDSEGEAIAATDVQYRVSDQDEVEIVPKATLASFAPGDTSVLVTVSAANNDLGTATRGLRVVELYVTSATGITLISTEYVIEPSSVLVVGVNSFQTYSAALMVGYEIPNLPGWGEASKTERVNALISAYRNFARLSLRYITNDVDAPRLTSLPADYLEAIRRAQVLEADYLLGGNEVDELRKSGIMSATVGESSQFFRTVKPFEGVVCKRAMKELSRYLISSIRTGRA